MTDRRRDHGQDGTARRGVEEGANDDGVEEGANDDGVEEGANDDGVVTGSTDGEPTGRRTGDPLLSVRDLQTHFHVDGRTVRAVDGVSFDVYPGETVCLVGESGSGKSVVCESISRLFPSPPGEIVGGEIVFDGVDVTELAAEECRHLRGNRIGHVFQNPGTSLNPVYSVGYQIREALAEHTDLSKHERRERAVELLASVGIPDAGARVDDYPHELSSGQQQRCAIAMALACSPDLLIADEPTAALDVTVQSGILELFRHRQTTEDTAILHVTHDMGVVAEVADHVVVCYAGMVLERGPVEAVLGDPAHPYTKGLLHCLPGYTPTGASTADSDDGASEDGHPDSGRAGEPHSDETTGGIGGTLPDPTDPPRGCRFAPRCPYAVRACTEGEHPPLVDAGSPDHVVSCVHYQAGFDRSTVQERSFQEARRGEAKVDDHPTGDRQ